MSNCLLHKKTASLHSVTSLWLRLQISLATSQSCVQINY